MESKVLLKDKNVTIENIINIMNVYELLGDCTVKSYRLGGRTDKYYCNDTTVNVVRNFHRL